LTDKDASPSSGPMPKEVIDAIQVVASFSDIVGEFYALSEPTSKGSVYIISTNRVVDGDEGQTNIH